MGKFLYTLLVLPLLVLSPPMALSQAQSPREQLTALVQQLQAAPADGSLREKIITLAQSLKPPPAIPEEARRFFVEGVTMAKAASGPPQQILAVNSFNQALAVAPWWGDAYYNLAVAQELAGQLTEAQASLRLYILTKPGAQAARDAQDRIYTLDAKLKMKAADESTKTANAAAQAGAAQNQFLESILGYWKTPTVNNNSWGSIDVQRSGDSSVSVHWRTYIHGQLVCCDSDLTAQRVAIVANRLQFYIMQNDGRIITRYDLGMDSAGRLTGSDDFVDASGAIVNTDTISYTR